MVRNDVRSSSWLRDFVESCSLLSDYEKSLVVRIDLEGKSVTEVAKSLGKAKSTVSSQHTRAVEKFRAWPVRISTEQIPENFEALVFRMLNTGHTPSQVIAKYGRAEEVKKLAEMWREFHRDEYWQAVKLLRDYGAISDSDTETKEPLFEGVARFYDWINEAVWAREDAEKKLAEYKRKYGTVKNLAAREEKLKRGIHRLEERLRDLEDENEKTLKRNKALKEEQEIIMRERKKVVEQAKEDLMTYDLGKAQLTELKKNLRYYQTTHGRNIKVGEIIKRKDFPLLYLVVGESREKDSWKIKLFDVGQLDDLKKKHETLEPLIEGLLSKKGAIEDWEVVRIGEDLSRI